jgi:hypothetical protein
LKQKEKQIKKERIEFGGRHILTPLIYFCSLQLFVSSPLPLILKRLPKGKRTRASERAREREREREALLGQKKVRGERYGKLLGFDFR